MPRAQLKAIPMNENSESAALKNLRDRALLTVLSIAGGEDAESRGKLVETLQPHLDRMIAKVRDAFQTLADGNGQALAELPECIEEVLQAMMGADEEGDEIASDAADDGSSEWKNDTFLVARFGQGDAKVKAQEFLTMAGLASAVKPKGEVDLGTRVAYGAAEAGPVATSHVDRPQRVRLEGIVHYDPEASAANDDRRQKIAMLGAQPANSRLVETIVRYDSEGKAITEPRWQDRATGKLL